MRVLILLSVVLLPGCLDSQNDLQNPAPPIQNPAAPKAPTAVSPASTSASVNQNGRVHRLKIGAFSSATVSSGEAQSIVSTMNSIVRSNGGTCNKVSFEIVRGPEKFASSLPNFVGDGNWRQFRDSPYSINIVSQILECGPHVVLRGQSFGGCTTVGSFPVTVIPSETSKRPSLWLHELGHSQKLHDRCRDGTCIGYVMAGVLDNKNQRMSEDECKAMFAPQRFRIRINEVSASNEMVNISDLLEMDWNHAMPVEQLMSLDEGEIAQVRRYVQSNNSAGLANAVLGLGLVGTSDDAATIFGVLQRAVEAPSGKADFGVVDAKLNVPVALGYLANQTGNDDIVSMLEQLRNPIQNGRYFQNLGDVEASFEYGRALARNVAVGSALSGTDRGARLLDDQARATRSREMDLRVDGDYLSRLRSLSDGARDHGIAELLSQAN